MEVIFVLLVVILDLWGIAGVMQSDSSGVGKLAWIMVILVLPLLGFLAWFLSGPKDNPILI